MSSMAFPLEGDADELGLTAVLPQLRHERPDVVLGASMHEGDLGFADEDALDGHRNRRAATFYNARAKGVDAGSDTVHSRQPRCVTES